MASIWLIPLLPGAGAALNGLLGIRWFSRRVSGALACAAIGAAFVMSVAAFVKLVRLPPDSRVIDVVVATWIPQIPLATAHDIGMFSVDWTARLDPLAAIMLLVVTGIGFLIHVYATGYMKDEPRGSYARFFCYLNLFCLFMLVLVLGGNFLVMFVGWEGVGLCSYLLIGFWYEKTSASDAGKKAFITNRVGDWGFILGIFLVFFTFGTLDFREVANAVAAMPRETAGFGVLSLICLLLFAGAAGKSAQLPLHVWLPDAMEGPTPVSALIHAATMVTAGVYMVARNAQLFSHAPLVLQIVGIVGALTALMAATIGVVQNDIKRVLAYSTISQLGYMFLATGVGAFAGAVFHLFTHAFFKALLFLGSGSVIHAMAGEQDMQRMGGLRKYMPVTFWTFMIGTLALAGIFPFAGFWSKDEILVTAGKSNFDAFMVIGLIGAFLTAAYMTRCVYLTFFGEYRGHGHPHESPKVITVPLIILSVFAVLAGFLNAAAIHVEKFAEWVEPRVSFPELVHPEFDYPAAVISLSIAALGIGIAAYFWFKREELHALKDLTKRNKVANTGYQFLVNKYYLDDLYENVIVAGIAGPIARASYWINQHVIDAVVNGAGKTAKVVGKFTYEKLDQRGVDGAVNGVAEITGESGGLLRYLQSGRVQRYALLLFGAVGLLSLFLLLANT
jgi:NADH-quinone oxidoreductase subunit L